MSDDLNNNNLKAPLPTSTGKPEITDGTNWFTLATEDWVLNNIATIPPCLVATVVNLTTIYVNGLSGVGATLTNSGAQMPLVIDGVALALGDRVLVKDQTTALQNGIYTVTNIGGTAVNWVLTRAADFDSPSQIARGDVVNVISGTVNAVTPWMLTSSVAIVGTDSITFAELLENNIVNIEGTSNQIIVTINNNIATISIAPNPIIPGNAGITLPGGLTSERPNNPLPGTLRFNTEI